MIRSGDGARCGRRHQGAHKDRGLTGRSVSGSFAELSTETLVEELVGKRSFVPGGRCHDETRQV
jgi:hypothetical protein